MQHPPLYLLSGLCADERLFKFLRLHHPSPLVIQWVTPDRQDTMASYAQKLRQQIVPGQEPPILIGLSFGGMVIQEMAKQMPVKRLILLSSLTNTQELPWHYQWAGAVHMQKWLPLGWFKSWVGPASWVFGAKSKEERQILASILQETDTPFLRWSLTQILHWRHKASPEKTVAIHGTQDKVLPVPDFPNLHLLPGGEHLMVMSRAQEVSDLINRYLK
ncbi:alpha/beta fold hydrolase [Rufibacter glacialis]|uniref:Alpha/beta fold hydrolase n=1 Tax=Rufibacter glacialis TaxID=1259555 RepID=A0A5M8Q903_9BACT|nr:alpha/beta hydrolase [Rufibacter glacialis]KAA6431663.1 alpha/beta hydrolase [Rufibacter glacialis]GGK82605.1 hypothetical protein GCM10011405_32980 [Rufibacter glacialis]